jgi:hypothetical protein
MQRPVNTSLLKRSLPDHIERERERISRNCLCYRPYGLIHRSDNKQSFVLDQVRDFKWIYRWGIHGYSPQRCLHLVVVVGLVRLCDPESNVGGSLTTGRATHAGEVKG